MTVIENEVTALVPTTGEMATQLALDLGAELNLVSLDLTNADMTYEQWETVGRALGLFATGWQWWVGDWLVYGETLFGEQAAQAVDDRSTRYDVAKRVTGKDEGTLMNVSSICRRIPKDQRVAGLSFTHHAKVASLDPDDRAAWLRKTVENQWGTSELAAELREAKRPEPLPDPDPDPGPQEPEVSRSELRDIVLNLVYQQAQPLSDGDYRLPSEVYAQVAAALGEQS